MDFWLNLLMTKVDCSKNTRFLFCEIFIRSKDHSKNSISLWCSLIWLHYAQLNAIFFSFLVNARCGDQCNSGRLLPSRYCMQPRKRSACEVLRLQRWSIYFKCKRSFHEVSIFNFSLRLHMRAAEAGNIKKIDLFMRSNFELSQKDGGLAILRCK